MAADEENAVFLKWNVGTVGLWENRAHWVYPINRNRDIDTLIYELRADSTNFIRLLQGWSGQKFSLHSIDINRLNSERQQRQEHNTADKRTRMADRRKVIGAYAEPVVLPPDGEKHFQTLYAKFCCVWCSVFVFHITQC